MRQGQFEERYRLFWQQFARQLTACEQHQRQPLSLPQAEQLLCQYADVCQHLAWAVQRDYSAGLVDFLQNLAERGHRQVYRYQSLSLWQRLVQFVCHDFPATVRAQKKVVYVAHVLFYLPFLLSLLLAVWRPDLMGRLVGGDAVASMYHVMAKDYENKENMSFGIHLMGMCFYIFHNIGLAFQAFASGLLLGIGSVLMAVYNGFMIGGAMGYMTHDWAATAFFSFVIAHGAFELTGLVLAVAGGLRLGLALLAPGRLPRKEALKQQGGYAAVLLCGAFAMLVIAAFIEGFWSPLTSIPIALKWIVGPTLWLLVYVYLWRAGR